MAPRTELDLNSLSNRMSAIRMSDSDRLVAMAAIRNGIIIVDAFAGLARAIGRIGDVLTAKPRLAR